MRADHRRRGLQEHERLLGHLHPELGRVRRVVLADAHELATGAPARAGARRRTAPPRPSGSGPRRTCPEHADRVRAELGGAGRDAIAEAEAHEPHGTQATARGPRTGRLAPSSRARGGSRPRSRRTDVAVDREVRAGQRPAGVDPGAHLAEVVEAAGGGARTESPLDLAPREPELANVSGNGWRLGTRRPLLRPNVPAITTCPMPAAVFAPRSGRSPATHARASRRSRRRTTRASRDRPRRRPGAARPRDHAGPRLRLRITEGRTIEVRRPD